MSFKQFSKSDWRRIVIFIVIFIALARFVMTTEITEKNCGFVTQRGFPFHYFFAEGGACEKNGVIHPIGFRAHFYLGHFILDVFIWGLASYLSSCFIVWIYDKVKEKKS